MTGFEELTGVGEPKQSIYIYPLTSAMFKDGANDYILKLRESLSDNYNIINGPTTRGMVDIIKKLPKTDILYFNWIEDLPDKRFGYVQTVLLFFVLLICKLVSIKIVWFVHNNTSHYRANWMAKQAIRKMMGMFSDVILSHSSDVKEYQSGAIKTLHVFDHPVEPLTTLPVHQNHEYDVVVWGTVSAYKGVLEFVQQTHGCTESRKLRILIAGKFSSEELYRRVIEYQTDNITIINKVLSDDELKYYLAVSKVVLFCYNSDSVLSSGALCKTLSFGKMIVGPAKGSFKDLGEKGMVHTYMSFPELLNQVNKLTSQQHQQDQAALENYIALTGWSQFAAFIVEKIGFSDAPGLLKPAN